MLQAEKKTQIVGILNCTPDSYYEKGRISDPEEAIEYALFLFAQGADVVDIGGESTRPGSDVAVSEEEELNRVLPIIKGIRKKTNLPLSIDTFKPAVARAALDEGVNWINDVTGFSHPEMRALARRSKVRICVMHALGKPHSIPKPHYPQGIIKELTLFFQKRIELLLNEGIESSQIILDPGIGGGAFGKSPEHSLQIIKHIKEIKKLGFPILIGLSRKSFLQKILKKPPHEVLSTTIALNTMSALEGIEFIRVHDVIEHRDILTILERLKAVI